MSAPRQIHSKFKGISGRRTIPIVPAARDEGFGISAISMREVKAPLPDLNNVQGDVFLRFPKTHESFIFFIISDVDAFKKALGNYKPTTSADVVKTLATIGEAKDSGTSASLDIPSTQIAFSQLGLKTLGINEPIGDARFDKGPMRGDKAELGDQADWDFTFDRQEVQGCIIVCSRSAASRDKEVAKQMSIFDSSIIIMIIEEGNTRPGAERGKEHFGFQDGVSDPSLRGLTVPAPGQLEVDPGVIVMGYEGDPLYGNSTGPKRPAWTKDGTIMTFRKLEQDVLGFSNWIVENGPKWRQFVDDPSKVQPPLNKTEAEEYFAATLVGRFKSGTPLALSRYRDDPSIGIDPNTTNNFDYTVPGVYEPSEIKCPFRSHIRKTNPRNLDPYVGRKFIESAAIIRAAIPYGPEMSEDTTANRGLLFNCYQSCLNNGFYRQTITFAGNNFFPTTSIVPQNHGQDPIIGGGIPPPTKAGIVDAININATSDGKPPKYGQPITVRIGDKPGDYEVTGFATKVNNAADAFSPKFWVTSRGGENFFVPSVSTLKQWSGGGGGTDPGKKPTASTGLDLVILQDATSSQQPYINQTQAAVGKIYDRILQKGTWERESIRIEIIAFREHLQVDPAAEFVTKKITPFTSDMGEVENGLADLKAFGGKDNPEAQCEALSDALLTDWNDGATKVVVLITDSPPHGLGEYNDKLPDGCPDQNDPVALTNAMKRNGITLFVIGCEPTLSVVNEFALDFYRGRARYTGGEYFPLGKETALADLIVGLASEVAATQKLAVQYLSEIQNMRSLLPQDIAVNLHAKMSAENVELETFTIDNIYNDTSESDKNVQTWMNATKLDKGTKSKLVQVRGMRLQQPYRKKGVQPDSRLETQAISLAQTRRVVDRALAPGS